MVIIPMFLFMKLGCEQVDFIKNTWFCYTLCRPTIARDGGMTQWTEWSCNSRCKSSRARNCTNPLPFFGGANCTDEGYEELEPYCYGNDCCPGKKAASLL